MKRLKRPLILLLACSLAGNIFTVRPVMAFSGTGSGSLADPYQISTCEQLQAMRDDLTANYVLVSDISCADTENWNDGLGFEPLGSFETNTGFAGSFNGQGHTINDLYIRRTGEDMLSIGLFSLLSGTAKNFGISGAIEGNEFTGGIAGTVMGGTIDNVITLQTVTGVVPEDSALGLPLSGVGGIVGGLFYGGTISHAMTGSLINASSTNDSIANYGGGLVGLMFSATIEATYNGGSLEDSLSQADVRSMNEDLVALGGAVGAMLAYDDEAPSPTVENVYAIGEIQAKTGNLASGLIGGAEGAVIRNSFAATTFDVTDGTFVNGFMSAMSGADENTLSNNYVDGLRTGEQTCTEDEIPETSCRVVNTSDHPDADYFFDPTNEPLSSWDFEHTWLAQDGTYPAVNFLAIVTDSANVDDTPDSDPEAEPDPEPIDITQPTQSIANTIHALLPAAARLSLPAAITLDDMVGYSAAEQITLRDLVVGQVIKFTVNVGGTIEHHTITIKEIGPDYVVLTIASTPFDMRFNIGKLQTVAINGKDVLNITLGSVRDNRATLTFSKILPTGAAPQPDQKTPAPDQPTSGHTTYLLVGGVAIIVAAVYIRRYFRSRQARITAQ